MLRITGLVLLAVLPVFPVAAVTISTASYVIAPNCCGSANVNAVNTVTIQNPEPYWHNQTFSFLWYTSVSSCEGTYNGFQEVCCVGDGNFVKHTSTWNGAPCPVEAKSRTLGWLGGGTLPYHEHQSESICEFPCTSCAPPGEDCDYWSDPFCDDPWGPY